MEGMIILNYKIEVRTDIIDPHTYLDIELDYKELLQEIYKCGGYALFQQLYKYFGNKSKGYREIKKLENLLLIGSEQLNNNKYVYLKQTSLKYLKYRNFETEVTESKVNRLLQKPGFRPIMNSVYCFEYLLEKKEYINEELSLKTFDVFISKAREAFTGSRIANIHLGRIMKDDYTNNLKTKLKILGDRNAIYLKNFEPSADIKSSTLEFVWFDFNQNTDENPVLRVLTLISRFLNNVGTTGKNGLFNCCNFSLQIVSLSHERKKVLEQLCKRAAASIKKKNDFYINSSVKTKENHVISNLKEIKIQIFEEIEGYLKVSTKGDSELGFVDENVVNRLENLKEHLNKVNPRT